MYENQITEPLIKINDLVKNYKDPDCKSRNILNIRELNFFRNKEYCIKGFSGSGKTTLLNIIAGILMPDNGSVVINNTNIISLKEDKRDKFRVQNIGYVFQEFNLLQGYTALENVLIAMYFKEGANAKARERALNLLGQVGLENMIAYKPSQLSYGQQQRVAIARALANNPLVVLADEPTGSLDKNTANDIIKLIKDIVKINNSTLILATHDIDLISSFQEVIEL